MTFSKSTIHKGIEIGYCIEKIEKCIPKVLRCFKCQKYGHHKQICRGLHNVEGVAKRIQLTWGMIVPKKPNAQTAKRTIPLLKNLQYVRKGEGNHVGKM